MRKSLALSVVAAAALCGSILASDGGTLVPPAISAEHRDRDAPPTIVLVHGAWAEASGWYDVTRVLQDRGYNVVALVYVAAFAPDVNEGLGGLSQRFPDLGLGKALVPDAAGFLYIDTAKYPEVFANGLPPKQARAFATAQKPIAGSAFGEPLTTPPAWKTIPSWYVVATEDRAINPDLERFMANRMRAKTTELRSGHLVFIARSQEIARIIETAAQ